ANREPARPAHQNGARHPGFPALPRRLQPEEEGDHQIGREHAGPDKTRPPPGRFGVRHGVLSTGAVDRHVPNLSLEGTSRVTPSRRHGKCQVHMSIFKLALGVIVNVAIFGVCLFLPAGTLDWWRAWVFLGVVFVGGLASTVTLYRVSPGLL